MSEKMRLMMPVATVEDLEDPEAETPYPTVPITVVCPLCGQDEIMDCQVTVETDYNVYLGTYMNAVLSGRTAHDCPNVTVPTP